MTIKVKEEIVTYGPDGKEIKSNEQESQDIIDENKLVNNQQNEGSAEKEIRDIQNNERRLIENMAGCQYTGDWNEKQRNEFLKTVNKLNEEQLMAPKENEINPQKSESQNQMGSAFTPQMQPSIPQPQYGDNTPIQMPQQESYTTNEGNTPIQMPQQESYTTNEGNTPTQMQNQPIVQYSQQPILTNTKISKENINYHYYSSEVYDDSIGCVTYIKKVKDNSKYRVSMSNYYNLSHVLRGIDRADTVDLAFIYISNVKKYDNKYAVKIKYINPGCKREKKLVFIDEEDCINNKIVSVMKQNGINCFNTEYSDKKISEYLYKLILSKTDDEQYDLPEGSGFIRLNGKTEFVSKELCDEKEIPEVTENKFKVSDSPDMNSEEIIAGFISSLKEQKSPEKFLLLNMIRVGGLLSHPLAWCNTYFSKLIFINGDCDELSKYLQIYNREDGRNNTVSINQKKECLKDVVSGFRDDVPVFYDEKNASTYRKNTGKDTIEWLSRENKAGKFIAVVFSDRLSQLVESKRAFVIDYSDYNPVINLRDRHIKLMTYCLDNKIIERVCYEFDDFKKCVNSKIDTYYESAANQNVDGDTFTYFMLVYNEIVRQYQEIKTIVTPEKMESFIIELLKKSDATYNGGSISEEFKTKLNQMFIEGKLELVENSKINRCFGSSGLVPKVFNDEDWLYFTAETFEFVTSQITLANNPNVLRKALLEKSLLKVSECMTYKATLYDSQYSGKVNVTAVSIGVLSEEARRLQKGGMFNYNPCSDEGRIDRICIGQDEKGRNVYWSIGHEYMSNSHLMVNGVSGAGKTTAVNLIVKELFRKKKKVIYVDFTQSATDKRLEQTGIDKEFISKNIMRNNINDVVNNPDELEAALSLLSEQDIILLFETSKYDESVESFLGMLYDRMVDGYTDSIYLVIDEIHELNYSKGSPLYNIMEKGRGKDVALIGIFQGAHETKPKQYSMLNQADMKLIFRLNDRKDAETVAESNGLKPLGEFADRILKLKKRKCLVVGNLEDDEGNLESRRFIEVEIANAY